MTEVTAAPFWRPTVWLWPHRQEDRLGFRLLRSYQNSVVVQREDRSEPQEMPITIWEDWKRKTSARVLQTKGMA